MPMNPRLLRPLASGVHPEAAAWRTAVVANGGTVSASTMNAVSKFCRAIDAAGIRSRFRRLNLFAGSSLSACLVPLYRGESRTGTQYGGITDANPGAGPFVSGDYEETGASGGLLGNSTSKHLNTGFRTQDLPGVNDCHFAIWSRDATVTTTRRAFGAIGGSSDVYLIDRRLTPGGGNQARLGGGSNYGTGTEDFAAQSMIASRTSSTSAVLYKNGTSVATQTTTLSGVTLTTQVFGVFTGLESGTTPNGFFPHRLAGYSIGAGLSAGEATSFHNAWAALQTALFRDRPSSDPAFAAVTNEDARLWIDNVYANGGTVSAATATAVNTFCDAIDAAGIRDRFYRLNLFCGTSDASLNAVRTPLYRGTSRTGAQYGGTLDTNFNFVQGDYSEAAGLLGTGNNGAGAGSTKYLNTGLAPSSWPAISSFHASAFVFGVNQSGPVQSAAIGVRNNSAPTNRWGFDYRASATQVHAGVNLNTQFAAPTSSTNQHWIASRQSVTQLAGYINGVSQFTDTTDVTASLLARPDNFFVFAQNTDTAPAAYFPFRMGGYSLGAGMTPTQATAFNAAMQAFQAAMGRQA